MPPQQSTANLLDTHLETLSYTNTMHQKMWHCSTFW